MIFRKREKKKRGFLIGLIRIVAGVLLLLIVCSAAQVLFVRFKAPTTTVRMFFEEATMRWNGKPYSPPDSHWRDLHDISPHLRKAVLAAEDQRFASHRGFDFVELENAVRDYLDKGRLRGASTITMQTARTLFLWGGRDFLRKGLEAWYTILMEVLVGKERILELYLNTVDWGADIRGAEAASMKYYGVSCDRLTPEQAALMAAILPRPHKWSPKAPTSYLLERRNRILKDMRLMPLL